VETQKQYNMKIQQDKWNKQYSFRSYCNIQGNTQLDQTRDQDKHIQQDRKHKMYAVALNYATLCYEHQLSIEQLPEGHAVQFVADAAL